MPTSVTTSRKRDSKAISLNPRKAPVDSVLRSMVNHEEASAKDWHKEILFGMFLGTEGDLLETLAKEIGPTHSLLSVNKNLKKTNRRSIKPLCTINTGSKFQLSLETSELTLIPHALDGFKERFMPTRKPSTKNLPTAYARPDCSSRSLEDLEQEVSSRFKQSLVGKKAVSFPSSYGASPQSLAQPTTEQTAEFEPFTLVYNECTLTAISKWSGREKEFDLHQAKEEDRLRTLNCSPFNFPISSPTFRHCSICKKWGHYEIECRQLKANDVIKLAQQIQVQKSLRGFVEDGNKFSNAVTNPMVYLATGSTTTIRNGSKVTGPPKVRTKGNEQRNATSNLTDSDDSDEYLTKSTACEICGSGFNSETLLLCDGCDGLFHAKCLDPPLESIPDGDWFCGKCEGYNSDVSSVVELEGCEGFVVEQRKIRADDDKQDEFLNSEIGFGLPDDQWSLAVGVVKRDNNAPSLFTNTKRVHHSGNEPPENENNTKSTPKEIIFSVGELCWTMRRSAPESQPGRNEWWPSTVTNLTNMGKQQKTDSGIDITQYIVKLYGVQGAGGRVRTSNIRPFFKHFEEFGYNRLFGPNAKSGVDGSHFRKAVEEATAEMGCNSLWHALMQTREIGGAGVSGESPQDVWNDAEVTEEEGFVLMAQRDLSRLPPPEEGKYFHTNKIAVNMQEAKTVFWEKENRMLSDLKWEYKSSGKAESSCYRKLNGCIVAWGEQLDHATISDDSSTMQFGVVIGADWASGKALIRALPEMGEMLEANRTVAGSTQVWRRPIRSCTVRASFWHQMDKLHLVSEPASASAFSSFSEDVTLRMKEERESFAALQRKMLGKSGTGRVKLVGIPNELSTNPTNTKENGGDKRASAGSFVGPTETKKRKVDGARKQTKTNSEEPASKIGNDTFAPKESSCEVNQKEFTSSHIYNPNIMGSENCIDLAISLSREESIAKARDTKRSIEASDVDESKDKSNPSERVSGPEDLNMVSQKAAGSDRETSSIDGTKSIIYCNESNSTGDIGISTKTSITFDILKQPENTKNDCSVQPVHSAASQKIPPVITAASISNSDQDQVDTTSTNKLLLDFSKTRKRNSEASIAIKRPTNDNIASTALALGKSRKTPKPIESVMPVVDVSAVKDPKGLVGDKVIGVTTVQSSKSTIGTSNTISLSTVQNPKNSLDEKVTDISILQSTTNNVGSKVIDISAEQSTTTKFGSRESRSSASLSRKAIVSSNDQVIQSNIIGYTKESQVIDHSVKSTQPVADTSLANGTVCMNGHRLTAEPDSVIAGKKSDDDNEQTTASTKQGTNLPFAPEAKGKKNTTSGKKRKALYSTPKAKKREDDQNMSPVTAAKDSGQGGHSPDTALTKEMFGDDVYQAERILDERKVNKGTLSSREYLIKWKGFSVKDSTWEPERNILNRNFVRMYQATKMERALRETGLYKQKDSVTYRMASALTHGRKILATGAQQYSRIRICPFCDATFRDALSFGTHMKSHSEEPNYEIIKDAAKLARDDWFEKK